MMEEDHKLDHLKDGFTQFLADNYRALGVFVYALRGTRILTSGPVL